MHQRIVFSVSTLLFTLIAVVVGILTDVHDRNFPEHLNASSNLYLDFTQTGLSDNDAFRSLASASDEWGVRLLKLQPDLSGDQSGQNLVALGSTAGLPDFVGWYGDQPAARVRDATSLRHSFATGSYLVAGDRTGLDDLSNNLTAEGVRVRREDDTPGQTVAFVVRQGSLRTTLLAAVGLMVSMALFWLTVKAKSRALRVLGGVSTVRIQVQDLGTFLLAVVLGLVPVTVLATFLVGLRHGWLYAPYYARTLVACAALLLAATAAFAVLMSVASWPTSKMLATRQPPVQSLRKASGAMKAVTFILVIAAAGPAWVSYRDASSAAAQQAQWKSLADQVALRYPGALGEDGFKAIIKSVGAVVRDADRLGNVALSYAMTPGQLSADNFGEYSAVALVDRRWLTLMLGDRVSKAVASTSLDEVPASVLARLEPNLEIWSRERTSSAQMLSSFTFLRSSGEVDIPLAEGGGGDLIFPDDALIIVVPDIVNTFNDDFLASLTSSNNLVFDGLEPTMRLLAQRDLEHTIEVKLVAEDGVLRAQFSAYLARLRGLAMVGLAGAFVLAAGISAFITAMLGARRDFPLRLSGRAWHNVLRSRVVREWATGGLLAAAVVLIQPSETIAAVAAAAAIGLVVTPLSHFLAARWCFANNSLRRL